MTDNRTAELLPCPICGKKVSIGLYGDERDYWWMVHGGMHYDECKCRLFMESCKFELESESDADSDERAAGIRDGLVSRWNTRAELGNGTLTAEQVMAIAGRHQPDYCSDTHVCFDWQAIADELNAELGSGTCEMKLIWTDYEDGECYECSACKGNTYTHGWTPNHCSNCGAKVKAVSE